MADFESLEAIAQSDALLDAIAGERRFTPGESDEQALVALLEGWRDGVRRPPIDHILSEDDAATALQRGRVQGPATPARTNKANRRGLTLVASAAAAVLAIGGFGGVVHSCSDAGIPDAHDDPQNFELKRFAGELARLLQV